MGIIGSCSARGGASCQRIVKRCWCWPICAAAIRTARRKAFVILDGTLIATHRVYHQRPYYSGEHGGNIQALSAPNGFPLWVSSVEPGATHDLTAAREHVLGTLYATASRGLPTLADDGYDGTGIGAHAPIEQPVGNQVLDADNRTYNALLHGLRNLGERGFALLIGRWRAPWGASPPTLVKSAASSKPHSH